MHYHFQLQVGQVAAKLAFPFESQERLQREMSVHASLDSSLDTSRYEYIHY